jgi:hypothetical protein
MPLVPFAARDRKSQTLDSMKPNTHAAWLAFDVPAIDTHGVVRRILDHLGHWAPGPAERGPPAQAPDWPANALIPLTYHAVPDIA